MFQVKNKYLILSSILLMNIFVTNNNYFFNTLSNKLDYERITEIINIRYIFFIG